MGTSEFSSDTSERMKLNVPRSWTKKGQSRNSREEKSGRRRGRGNVKSVKLYQEKGVEQERG